MPFHIFLAQSLSLVTGGLEGWKIGKDVLLFVLTVFTICLVYLQGRATFFFKALVWFFLVYGFLHLLIWDAHPDSFQKTALLGTIYNVRLACFAVLGAGAVLMMRKFVFSSVVKLVLIVSTIVTVFGIMQYFLPNDFLTHFGYGLDRGARAAFYIDDNPLFPRIMSTLREPNALGAYLILPATILSLLIFRIKDMNKRYIVGGIFGLHIIAIFLTQSRSTWAALLVSLVLAFFWQHRVWFTQFIRRFWYIWAALVILVVSGTVLLRNTHFVQGYVIHTSSARTSQLDSNDYHALLIKQGLKGVRDYPLGHGPGTAGIVSIQNPGGGQLTENYYIQIAYEVGIPGLLLFLAANIWLYIRLWRRRDYIGVAMCASFWAYFVTNMLLHTWSNEAVAAQWWILAGMLAIGTSVRSASAKRAEASEA
jgi:O-antigen ligase